MKEHKIYLLISLLFLSSLSVFAKDVIPQQFVDSLNVMYPDAENVQWSSKHGYKIARFYQMTEGNQDAIMVWFNSDNATWVMTETGVQTTLQLPLPVTEAFSKNEMSGLNIQYIRIITFPVKPEIIVIELLAFNGEEYQMFYNPDGKLIQTLNGYIGEGEIYPDLFN